jgi:hypothetical protein
MLLKLCATDPDKMDRTRILAFKRDPNPTDLVLLSVIS